MKFRKIFFLVFLVSIAQISLGQNSISVGEFLSSSTSARELEIIKAQSNYVDGSNFRSPFFREFELRVRARDFESGLEDYRFRFSPLNPYERRANKEYEQLLQQQLNSQYIVEYSEILVNRYKLILDYYFLELEKSRETNRIESQKNLLTIWINEKQSVAEIIKLDRNLLKAEIQLLELNSEIDRQKFKISSTNQQNGALSLEGFELIGVEQVKSFLNEEDGQNILLENERNKLLLSESDLEINRQESFSNIGYIQAEYRPYRGETFSETMGMQVAFQLPITNPDRPDLQRRYLEVLEDRQEASDMEILTNENQFLLENKIKATISQYELLNDKLISISQLKSTIDVGDFAAVIEFEEYINSIQEDIASTYYLILDSYIEWLHFNGQLVTPGQQLNYLSAALEALE